ncbi:MAG: undecaprenyldiphospho-muramoylpentapeptide beta-N-acetylglucosaminyltransferase [Clostridia bacterium]|nr:undecaprenyldiphospho-muramoylpentapeptide beta-N-acetylglucosaminyltransferase [Clostridia bacterium]
MLKAKRILIAAGGTGGHINPALSVAGYIKEQNPSAEVLFVGTADKMEAKLVPQAGFPIKMIDISGFRRDLSLGGIKHNIKTVSRLLKSSGQAKKIIEDFKPELAIGFGGYVSGPVIRMAAKLGVPTAIHEQNAFPGVTNKTLAKQVDRVMLTSKAAEKYLEPKNPCVFTGLPVRADFFKADKDFSRAELGQDSRPLILSSGGSLGAEPINKAIVELIAAKAPAGDCCFIHATGHSGTWVSDELKSRGVDPEKLENVTIREYIDDMSRCMSACDIFINRAGASTLSEIQALGKPSILIPSPYVAENHQYHNAMTLVEKGAAVVIEEKDLTGERLINEINSMLADTQRLNAMGEGAKQMSVSDAAKRIYDCLCEIA